MSRVGGLLRRAAVRLTPGRRAPAAGTGVVVSYRPSADGRADPGEVVWAWVPFEEDATRGKDRPVLVVGRDGDLLVGLMLTSKDHDGAERRARDAGQGRRWMDVGAGGWDRQGRPSEVRLDRVLHLDPKAVRREGATLDERRFRAVADAARALHGWA
ncbi:MAG: hypothetical protein JWO90_3187 [Solirubrobacterales bacterium]|nr:hypothetical protein [Solirubrobacterales bacterium]